MIKAATQHEIPSKPTRKLSNPPSQIPKKRPKIEIEKEQEADIFAYNEDDLPFKSLRGMSPIRKEQENQKSSQNVQPLTSSLSASTKSLIPEKKGNPLNNTILSNPGMSYSLSLVDRHSPSNLEPISPPSSPQFKKKYAPSTEEVKTKRPQTYGTEVKSLTPSFHVSSSPFSSHSYSYTSSYSYSSKTVKFEGFKNLGNTCYLNAILQSLTSFLPFIEDLKHPTILSSAPTNASFYQALIDLLREKLKTNHGVISLNSLKESIGKLNDTFRGFEQMLMSFCVFASLK
eukprot:TRINITY_DN3288_c0_g1_i1.p1 TRINITY_DN3288_c0_g1~~TRINITY_DN3288_c0_g1_i1.p1  ORF type:complete len:287 (-),score=48.81 TRINITY_DN3288_c0_g1_i1:1053-1913(-)